MKKINFTIILILFFTLSTFAQNKKEQIETLNQQVDSLFTIVSKQAQTIEILLQEIEEIKTENKNTQNKIDNLNILNQNSQNRDNEIAEDIITINTYVEYLKQYIWHKPTQADMQGDWEYLKSYNKTPYYAKGDFDNDNMIDEAWIEINETKTKMRLSVYLSNSSKPIILSEFDTNYSYYISEADAGTYETWCGKTGDCEDGAPKEVVVKNAAINFGYYEVGSSIFVWDKDKFIEIGISD